ncbi:hypothetical protein EMIT0P100_110167 [Pseudomonas sp. IT-P100]
MGMGLLAKGPYQMTSMLDDTPLSRANPLPQEIFSERNTCKRHPKGAFRISASGKPALPGVTRHTLSDNVRLSIAAGMLGPQLHGRSL